MKGYKNVGMRKAKQPSVNRKRRRQEKFLQTQQKNGRESRKTSGTGWKPKMNISSAAIQGDVL